MQNVILLSIVKKFMWAQNNKSVFTFHEIVNLLMESSGHDDINDFVRYLDNANQINNGNPYFKDAVLQLYRNTEF